MTAVGSGTDTALGALTVTGATLNEAVSADTLDYTANADAATTRVTIVAAARDTAASVAVNPADTDAETDGHQIDLLEPQPGGDPTRTAITIAVRSADTTELAAHTLTITRAAPVPADLVAGAVPEVGISGPAVRQTGPFTVTFAWSELVTDFTADDVRLTHGTLSGFAQDTDHPHLWTAIVTPPEDFSGAVWVAVPAGAATFGTNVNSRAQQSFPVDTRVPIVSFSVNKLDPAAPGYLRGHFKVRPKFSEPVSGWSPVDFVINNAKVVGRFASSTGYTRLRPIAEGTVTISAPSGAVQDGDGNPNPAASITLIYDVTRPTVKLSSPFATAVQGSFDLDIVFSEPVAGLDVYDIQIDNATLSNLTGEGTAYRVMVTPAGRGRIAATVRAGAVNDAAGNTSRASGRWIRYDVTAATVPQGLALAPGENRIAVQWDEPVGDSGSGHRVEWKAAAQPWSDASFATVPAYGREHAAGGLDAATAYDVRVAFTYGSVTGPWAQATATTSPDAGIPDHSGAALETLTLAGATLDRSFKPTITSYTATAAAGTSQVTVAVVPAEAGAQVVITPEDAASGTDGHQIDLPVPEPGGESTRTAVVITVRSAGAGEPLPYTVTIESPAAEAGTATVPAGTPQNVRISPYHSRLLVSWEAPEASVEMGIDNYVVRWRYLYGSFTDDRRATVIDLDDPEVTIADVSYNIPYVVQITSRSGDDEIASAVAETWTVPASEYIEQNFIEPLEGAFPWVRQAWDRKYRIVVRDTGGLALAEFIPVDSSAGGFSGLHRGKTLGFHQALAYTDKYVVVHELAHGLTMDHRAPDHPGPIGISWLYVVHRLGGCYRPWEILADLVAQRTTGNNGGYVRGCRPLLDGRTIDAHARVTMDSVLGGEIPQWFYDHYQGDEPALDLDSVWFDIRNAQLRLITRDYKRTVAYHLRGLFGGFCSLAEAHSAVDQSGGLEQGNPWVDGGCARRRPQNLTLTAAPEELTVTWQAQLYETTPVVTHYVVQWRTADQQYGAARQAVVAVSSGQMSHRIAGLADGTQYFVRVAAVNADSQAVFTDDDGHSRVAEATAVAGGPAAPADMAVASGDAQVTLRWAAPAGDGPEVTGYVVQWKSGAESYASTRRLVLDDASARSATVTGLVNGTPYTLRVAAVAGSIVGAGSEVTATAGLPGTPGGVTVRGGEQSFRASWEAAPPNGSDITGYVVQWRFGGDRFSGSREIIVGPAKLAQTVENLVGGTKYYVRVMAMNAHGRGEPSAAYAVTTTEPVDRSAPTVHIGVPRGVQGAPFTVTFTWSEWVEGFSADGIAVSEGTLSDLVQDPVEWLTWTATVTPPAAFRGTATIVVRGGAATDGANRSTSTSHDVRVDTSAP